MNSECEIIDVSFEEVIQGPPGPKGDKGDTGSQGPQGLQGERGPQGPEGKKGERGERGSQGPKGDQGDTGVQGKQGPRGEKGDKGDKGDTGSQGNPGPMGPRGEPFQVARTYDSIEAMNASYASDNVPLGGFVIIATSVENPDNAKVFVKGSRKYEFVTDMSGATGIVGPQGEKGDKGDRGERGPQGIQGDRGLHGDKGERGEKGDKGDTGPKGDVGPQGIQGARGLQGEKGDKGDTGPIGPTGPRALLLKYVDARPDTGEEGVIYSYPSDEARSDNRFDESYMREGRWEKFGGGGALLSKFFITFTVSSGTADLKGIAVTARSVSGKVVSGSTDDNGVAFLELDRYLGYSISAVKAGLVIPHIDDVTIDSAEKRISASCYALASIKVQLIGSDTSGRTVTMSGKASGTKVTDTSGAVTFDGLDIGTYQFTADYPEGQGIRPVSVEQTAEGGGAYTVSMEILSKPVLRVTVQDKSGPKTGVTVTATPSTAGTVTGVTNESGTAELTILGGVAYTVSVTPTAEYIVPSVQTVTATAGTTEDMAFTLQTKPTAKVTVTTNIEGKQSNLTVQMSNGTDTQTQTTDASGIARFTAEGVGEYTFTVLNLPDGVISEPVVADMNGDLETLVAISVKYPGPKYGIRIKRSEPDPDKRVEYIDDAVGMTPAKGLDFGSWGNTSLFRNIKPVVRFTDGTWKDLDKRDLMKCTDGTPSNIDQIGNDAFTEIPTWWIHMSRDDTYSYIRIAQEKVDDTYHAMHAMDNGIQRDCFHVGCYCAYSTGGKCYSSLGRQPSTGISTQDFATQCQARGAGFDQFSWYPWNFIAALFVLAYKSTNSQTAMVRGYVDGRTAQIESRTTFDNDFGLAGSSSGTEQMSFLWLQNFWGNGSQFIGGAKTNSQNQLMAILDGKDCTTNESDFTTVGSDKKNIGGHISEMDLSSSKVGFFPKATSGSTTTYWCDYGYVGTSFFLSVSGYCGSGDKSGVFLIFFNYGANKTDLSYGSRLMYKGGR